jgi:hypothetical protein
MTSHRTEPDGMRFTPDRYEELLVGLLDDGYEFVGYGDPGPREVILRHDVDLSPERALAMARIEADLGVTATYFFLLTTPVYNPIAPRHRRAIEGIESLGHDVGLHFDTHQAWDDRPGRRSVVETVTRELAALDRLVDEPVDVVSFHVPPDWVLDRSFEGFTNAYAPRYFSEITYLSDSNQKWRVRRPFADGVPETLQLLVHPGLWESRDRGLEAIVADLADRTHHRVDRYLHRLGP